MEARGKRQPRLYTRFAHACPVPPKQLMSRWLLPDLAPATTCTGAQDDQVSMDEREKHLFVAVGKPYWCALKDSQAVRHARWQHAQDWADGLTV